MSHPLKKPRAVYPIEEDILDEEPQNIQDELIGQTIDIDFDAFRAEDGDFHGIKTLLQQTFRGLNVDFSGIANIVISQNYIGSVVKQVMEEDCDDEDDMEDSDQIFGISTIINLTSRKDEDAISQLRSVLVELCHEHGDDSVNQLLRESLGNENKHVGLLISERLVNLPAQFALPVYDSLIKEVETAKKKGMAYDFTYLVMVSKVYKLEKKKKNRNTSQDDQIMWSNPEEEIFFEESLASFEFRVKGDTGHSGKWEEENDQYSPWRRVMVFEANKLPAIIIKVKQAVT